MKCFYDHKKRDILLRMYVCTMCLNRDGFSLKKIGGK